MPLLQKVYAGQHVSPRYAGNVPDPSSHVHHPTSIIPCPSSHDHRPTTIVPRPSSHVHRPIPRPSSCPISLLYRSKCKFKFKSVSNFKTSLSILTRIAAHCYLPDHLPCFLHQISLSSLHLERPCKVLIPSFRFQFQVPDPSFFPFTSFHFKFQDHFTGSHIHKQRWSMATPRVNNIHEKTS